MPYALIVDDDMDARDIMALFVETTGYQVQKAPNGKTALAMMAETVPDVLVLDMMMPEMSGMQILARMSKDMRLKSIPVIIVSALELSTSNLRGSVIGVLQKGDLSLTELREMLDKITPPNTPT